jgi:hypothetical protein
LLPGGEGATVDVDGLAGDVSGAAGREEVRGFGDVVRCAGALVVGFVDERLMAAFGQLPAEEVGAGDTAGGDDVAGDAAGAELALLAS